ncbi:unnamed protein product [Cylicostephanus goldi]|uniref:TAZ-type domain-containing protein n=1 Tax=Cylicostephanus goldi TaxID=71465 RepID=A0A3P6RGZ5_CYLGO|nr:unnamed protein product [Cylicostephanus goldi]
MGLHLSRIYFADDQDCVKLAQCLLPIFTLDASLPAGLEELGSKEEVRDYLGDLIHALRSHCPCSILRRDDPLWCGKISCMRLGIRWCHMHECTHYQRNCTDENCLRSQAVISHWLNCTDSTCFVCLPWIRPRSLESQPKRFLNDIFGSHCFLGRIVSPVINKNRAQPSGGKKYEFVCAEKQIKDDRYRMFAMVNEVTAASINESERLPSENFSAVSEWCQAAKEHADTHFSSNLELATNIFRMFRAIKINEESLGIGCNSWTSLHR